MHISDEAKLNIWISIAFEGAVRTARTLIENNGGLFEFRERVLNGRADFGKLEGSERAAVARACATGSYLDVFISGLERDGVMPIAISDDNYPSLLREIFDPPYVLYARGNMVNESITLPISVIGTRRCSDYGKKVASLVGKALADCGATVISGLAYGCDSYAHEGALKSTVNDFPTAAVLGHGVLIDKSDSTRDTMERILDRGVVISEFLPHSPVNKWSFPMRNRIISGISSALVVAEAGQKSGTMITVNCALEQGRDVYAVPCRITETLNCGTNEMLQKGWAQPVYGIDDLLVQIGLRGIEQKHINNIVKPALDGEKARLYEHIGLGEKNFDELIEVTALSVEKLNLYLTEMELSGLIKQLPGRVYTLT
ncbi:MAG: DNA-processing protein DprA [Clostridia bacterium]|nr:DNA-processing protein DprA [Clostridia bacterium]